MREYELSYPVFNSESYVKWITAYAVEPDALDEETGAMLFHHGWGGNRFQYADMMRDFAERYNLVCLSPEFRQSGFDFDPVRGRGSYRPYDASFAQVFDGLAGLRLLLELRPHVNRSRLYTFGGSQGGHITLLAAIYAPNTFALTISACAISQLDPGRQDWAGRRFPQHEIDVRDVVRLIDRIRCPVVAFHGDADETVPVEHFHKLEAALRRAGIEHRTKVYPGGSHSLAPTTSREAAVVELADDLLRSSRRDGPTDFESGDVVRIPCAGKVCVIDWSKPCDAMDFVRWEDE